MKILIMILLLPFLLPLYITCLLVLSVILLLTFPSSSARAYLKRNFIAIDQAANALFLGDEDETISSRLGKRMIKHDKCPFCNLICRLLNLIDKNHCVDSIEYDEGEPL